MALLQSKPSSEDKDARIRELEDQLAKAKTNGNGRMSFKVSDKGALSVYGMGRFPVTLYRSQWERLLGAADEIRSFITANADKLAVKS